MGDVWLAEQEKPRREVALKLIRRGLDTQQVVLRFEAERQALAVMDHASIAKVFDAGETEQGLPYFVMEYVDGEPITRYCDRHRLSTRERLDLFLQVCRGVEHAHQKGVIHRDLKPSNVLVATQDGKGHPKIIDFGIAKAIDRELTERTLFTELGQMVGTPEYMAPEQADYFEGDVDTRADVYSLGVLLYELLVGDRPFHARELRKAGLAEIQRYIREVEPPKPSTRLSTLSGTGSAVAELRRTDVSSLIRVLQGDLDWITMKALEKERARRYGSVSDLMQDVGRHLNSEPVLARPPSLTYRARKFVRRHLLATVAAAAVFLALLTGTGVATWQAIEARKAQREAAEQAERADRQALTSERTSRFLLSLFRSTDPYRSQGEESLSDVLDRGLEQIDDLGNEPMVQADLLATLGDAMMATGRRQEGVELIARALALRERELPADDPELLYTRWLLEDRSGTGPIDEKWLELARTAHAGLATRTDFVSRNRTAQMLISLGAGARAIENDSEMARRYFEQALAQLEQLELDTGQPFQDTPTAMENLGFVALMDGDLDRAVQWYERALQYTETVFGKDHIRYAQSLGQTATLLRDQRRFAEAERAAEEAYDRRLVALGRETGNVVYDLGVLASVYRAQGKLEEAERWAREALAVARRVDQGVDVGLCKLADVLAARGSFAEVAPLLDEAWRLEADANFDCQRARGLLLIAEGASDAGDTLLIEAWQSKVDRDPLNITVPNLAAEAERAHREAGNDAEADAWRERLEGLEQPPVPP